MKIVIGLGNPGKKYENNRHNVGHMFIDYLASLESLRVNDLKLVKTDCFMNQSGIFVKKLTRQLAKPVINNIIIIHDDLDIPLGKFHIQKGVGPQLHNGLESIEQHLKTKDFWRVRIGIDNRKQNKWTRPERSRGIDGETYVLKNFLPEEKSRLEKEIFPRLFVQFQNSSVFHN